MAAGRKKPEQVRTTSYPQSQEGKPPVTGDKRTTSYKSAMQVDRRDYQTIN